MLPEKSKEYRGLLAQWEVSHHFDRAFLALQALQ
jgi:hypothetical protein